MEQKPTVGRIVHVYGALLGPGVLPPPNAAIITALYEASEEFVDLTVFGTKGVFQHYEAKYSAVPQEYRWTWPPKK